jgi:hypothetical protein
MCSRDDEATFTVIGVVLKVPLASQFDIIGP